MLLISWLGSWKGLRRLRAFEQLEDRRLLSATPTETANVVEIGGTEFDLDGTESVAAPRHSNSSDNALVINATGGDNLVGDDHGNDASSATGVGVPSRTPGNIEQNGDKDWFGFDVVSGSTYTISTALETLNDSTLTLIGTDGVTVVGFDDDVGGDDLSSLLEFAPQTAGTYYAVVAAFGSNRTGSYTLNITGRTQVAALTVNIVDSSISENGGASTATVTRNTTTAGDLTVFQRHSNGHLLVEHHEYWGRTAGRVVVVEYRAAVHCGEWRSFLGHGNAEHRDRGQLCREPVEQRHGRSGRASQCDNPERLEFGDV